MIHTIDLHFLNIDHSIASFLVETNEGPVIIETGPYSTIEAMKSGLKSHGYELRDIKHVLLTHIHFDHAGAAWAFADAGATIYLHPFGAPHLEDPSKLYGSAKQIYGEMMETLWGAMNAIPAGQLYSVADGEKVVIGGKTFLPWHTPGHAKHHIAWQLDDIIFAGDVAGVKIDNGPVVPPCPPPDINLEDWNQSLDILLEKKAQKLFLTHYGEVTDIGTHFLELRKILDDWAGWIKEKWESGQTAEEITPQFTEYTKRQLLNAGVSLDRVVQYEAANPSWMSVAGLMRYWKKREG